MVQKGRAARMCRGVSRLVAEMTPVWLHCNAATDGSERVGCAKGKEMERKMELSGMEATKRQKEQSRVGTGFGSINRRRAVRE
jgi:hypothetical protein